MTMNATQPATQPSPHVVVLTLARLLERLEQGQVDADQYRVVVCRLAEVLQDAAPDATLRAVLDAHPATAEVYENLNYRYAGLCRSPLDAALDAEQQAKVVLARAASKAAADPQG
jgi:hypothetical protein